ncbi:MAG: hypothetical protein PHE51_02950 [Eubacteriales bacterium]|nr:hypothetical protein [Eubacteriales bacterium]
MYNKDTYDKKPAIVKYIGEETNEFSCGKEYYAYFLEYWQGERVSLHVKGNSGEITDFNPFEYFEVASDQDNVLNMNEAIVECLTHNFDDTLLDIKYGRQYRALGRDKDGYYLIMDESYDCYFYPAGYFKIIDDKFDLLSYHTLYYSYCE